jgi:hypothetical protein
VKSGLQTGALVVSAAAYVAKECAPWCDLAELAVRQVDNLLLELGDHGILCVQLQAQTVNFRSHIVRSKEVAASAVDIVIIGRRIDSEQGNKLHDGIGVG